MGEHAPRPLRLCSPQIVRRTQTVRSAQFVRRAQIVRCTETEPPSTMMLSHFSGGNPAHVTVGGLCYTLFEVGLL